MKTKKIEGTFKLNKETVTNLEQSDMANLYGGTYPTKGPTCVATQTFCGLACP